jgi:hypothetical protein
LVKLEMCCSSILSRQEDTSKTRSIELCLRFTHVRKRVKSWVIWRVSPPEQGATIARVFHHRLRYVDSRFDLISGSSNCVRIVNESGKFELTPHHPTSPLSTPMAQTRTSTCSVHHVSSINNPVFLILHLTPHLPR